jgi:dephospho-CoA kinase
MDDPPAVPNPALSVDVLFLTGQPGAGKTAVAKELSELLWQRRAPHAVIDIDELCRGLLPTRTTDFNRALAAANLQAVWANYHAAGVRRLILARIVEALDDIERFSVAIPNARVTVCLLQAPEATIRQRITEREAGSARAFLLRLTARNAEQMAALELPGFRVENDGRTLNAVAREILERAGWT